MATLPSGTVTFFISDMERSTALVQALGDAWPEVLDRHLGILRAATHAHSGVEVGSEGDSLFAAFATPQAGLAAAVDALRALDAEEWPDQHRVLVRIGLHLGEAMQAADGYAGIEVHRAARVSDAAHGGQLLVSRPFAEAVSANLAEGLEIRRIGRYRLRGIPEPEELFQVVIDGLPAEFPTPRHVELALVHVPRQLTSFIAREADVARILLMLDGGNLVTLTGPGGTGKTRLAVAVAERAVDHFADGVVFVALAAVRDPSLVPARITQELGLPDRGGRTATERLVDYLRNRRLLLVLDNFEQVAAAGQTVSELLASLPGLVVLVTSRLPLRVYGEREYHVPPMAVPAAGSWRSLEQLGEVAAVALFVERARAGRPDFALTDANAAAVAEICVRLDGLPLAIELAASRIRMLSAQDILERLGSRLELLSSGARDLPERQRTLRSAIAWSYDLLPESAQRLFGDLSVFVGGGDLEAIEAACAAGLDDVLGGVGLLVDHSLVQREHQADGTSRYLMLETIREFATEVSETSGERTDALKRHALHFRDLAARAGGKVMGADKRRWLDLLDRDHDNIRAALDWTIEAGEAETALRLVSSLWRFWQMRGHLAEGLRQVQRALALPADGGAPELRASALTAGGGLAYWMGDSSTARALYQEALDLRKGTGDVAGIAAAEYDLAFAYLTSDAPRGSAAHLTDLKTGHDILEEARRQFDSLGDIGGAARATWGMGISESWSGRLDPAREHLERGLTLFREVEDRFMEGWAVYMLALVDLAEGRSADAAAHLSDALEIFEEADDLSGFALGLDGVAAFALNSGDRVAAARISGAVAELERVTGAGLNPHNRHTLGFAPETLRDDPDTADAWALGADLSLPEVVAFARDEVLRRESVPRKLPA